MLLFLIVTAVVVAIWFIINQIPMNSIVKIVLRVVLLVLYIIVLLYGFGYVRV